MLMQVIMIAAPSLTELIIWKTKTGHWPCPTKHLNQPPPLVRVNLITALRGSLSSNLSLSLFYAPTHLCTPQNS